MEECSQRVDILFETGEGTHGVLPMPVEKRENCWYTKYLGKWMSRRNSGRTTETIERKGVGGRWKQERREFCGVRTELWQLGGNDDDGHQRCHRLNKILVDEDSKCGDGKTATEAEPWEKGGSANSRSRI